MVTFCNGSVMLLWSHDRLTHVGGKSHSNQPDRDVQYHDITTPARARSELTVKPSTIASQERTWYIQKFDGEGHHVFLD